MQDALIGQVQNDESIRENTFSLQSQALSPRPRKAGEDKALLFLLDVIDLSLYKTGDNSILDDGVVSEEGIDLLAEFLLLADFFLEQIANRDGGELVVIGHLQCELPHLEPWWTHDKDFLI